MKSWGMLLVAGLAVTSGQGSRGSADAARAASDKMVDAVGKNWPAGVITTTRKPGEWSYEEGVLLDGMAAQWQVTRDAREMAYIRAAVDRYVRVDGQIQMSADGRAYPVAEHTLDDIEMGRAVLFLYLQTYDNRYRQAAEFLHGVLAQQPRGPSGAYWHKQIYPNQVWLDGAYMAEPFRAEYAAVFGLPGDFDDVARQFLLMDAHMREAGTGLLRHGWDESKQMGWANKETGLSPEIWARAVGWYAMALVDVLDWFPAANPRRAELVADLRRTMQAVAAYQDESGLWWQVMDAGSRPGRGATAARAGNFEEASASCMFVYALAKGARLGYLPAEAGVAARRGWAGIQAQFVERGADGTVRLTGTVKAAGLGGRPYRSGTYAYYVGEPRGDDDAKGVGAYLMAGSEMER